MPRRTVRCQKCPTEFTTPFSQRRYCLTCQILRDSEVFPFRYGAKATQCDVCHVDFWPAKTNWSICSACIVGVEEPSRYAPCNVCGGCYKTAPGLDETCSRCVQGSPEARILYINALRDRRERLIQEEKSANSEENRIEA